mmetsp:Transcript_30593/g.71479  ORF Transcript_30593/g.71479 Transcript_30593/m.71479 type:complete len:200 (+) Transcript_30593:412-1011(+)
MIVEVVPTAPLRGMFVVTSGVLTAPFACATLSPSTREIVDPHSRCFHRSFPFVASCLAERTWVCIAAALLDSGSSASSKRWLLVSNLTLRPFARRSWQSPAWAQVIVAVAESSKATVAPQPDVPAQWHFFIMVSTSLKIASNNFASCSLVRSGASPRSARSKLSFAKIEAFRAATPCPWNTPMAIFLPGRRTIKEASWH